MAEVIYKRMIDERFPGEWQVESAGVWASEGEPATENARLVMQERGLDLSTHHARFLSLDHLTAADTILVMEYRHKQEIEARYPETSDRVLLITELSGKWGDVMDPVGGSMDAYRTTAGELTELLERGIDRLIALSSLQNS